MSIQLKLINDHLLSRGLNAPDILSDSKFHRFPSDSSDDQNLAWYVCSRNFASKTGEEFFTVLSGDWNRGIRTEDFCTLVDISTADKAVIKKRIKEAHKLEVAERNQLLAGTVDYDKMIRDELAAPLLPASNKPMPFTPEGMSVRALGFNEKEYFFTSSGNRQIISVSRFSQVDLLGLQPIDYWESAFPGAGAQRVNWVEANSHLMRQARAVGIFQPRNVRGSGVWNDAGRTVVHMGDHLIVDGERVGLGEIKSRYFYTLGSSLTSLHKKPLSVEECSVLVEACGNFKWLRPDYGFLMAGALVVNRVCGALPIRPHVWLTGGAQTGKTTLLDKLIKPMLGPNRLYVQGGTTEAGIRQALKADAIPLLFDEFETTGQKSGENIAAVIELLRAAWSDSDAQVVKGSAGGTASYFLVRCCAIVSSIRTKLTNDADLGRFARLELAPHGNDQEHWNALSSLLCDIDEEYSDRMFARTVALMPVLLANYKTLKLALARRVSQRFGDQYGMLLAGYSLLIDDEAMTLAQAESLVEAVHLEEEKDQAKTADHDDCMTHMLTKKFQMTQRGDRQDFTVGEAISLALDGDQDVKEGLMRIGIRVDYKLVIISSTHNELQSLIFARSRWSESWAHSLMRIPGAKRSDSIKIGGKSNRGVILPLHLFKN